MPAGARTEDAVLAGGPSKGVQINPAITHFVRTINKGTHWYLALLEAIALWDEPRERFRGEDLVYLIGGEALDWLLLAWRLSFELDTLLFEGEPPIQVSAGEFRERIGPVKYRCFLNYFYGVTVEEALLLLYEEELRRHSMHTSTRAQRDAMFTDLYGATERDLLRRFCGDKPATGVAVLDVQQAKAYMYFLFKHRLAHCLPPRVASDTKRGLAELRRQYTSAGRDSAFAGRPDGLFEEPETSPDELPAQP
jgi:hypothetical protein